MNTVEPTPIRGGRPVRFAASAAYRVGQLDGAALYAPGADAEALALARLRRPAWARQSDRVRRAYLWGWCSGWRWAEGSELGTAA